MYIDFKEALDIELKDLHYLEKRHDLAPKRWYEMYGFLIIPIEWNYCIKLFVKVLRNTVRIKLVFILASEAPFVSDVVENIILICMKKI